MLQVRYADFKILLYSISFREPEHWRNRRLTIRDHEATVRFGSFSLPHQMDMNRYFVAVAILLT